MPKLTDLRLGNNQISDAGHNQSVDEALASPERAAALARGQDELSE